MIEIPNCIKDFASEVIEKTKHLSNNALAVYIVGSRTLPWIKHPNDWDITVVIRSAYQMYESYKEIMAISDKYKEQFDSANVHCLVRNFARWNREFDTSNDFITLQIYSHPYIIKVEGEDLVPENAGSLTLTYKNVLIPKIRAEWETQQASKDESGVPQFCHRFYHLLSLYYIFLNNSTELTQEQQDIISDVHDDIKTHLDIFNAFGDMLNYLSGE